MGSNFTRVFAALYLLLLHVFLLALFYSCSTPAVEYVDIGEAGMGGGVDPDELGDISESAEVA